MKFLLTGNRKLKLPDKMLACLGLLIVYCIFFGCDESNTVGPDTNSLYTNKIQGYVHLENQNEHSNALVYLDSLDRGVSTDSNGFYSILFCEEDSVYNGTFKLIYYVNEYDIDTAQYVLIDGKVKLDSLDIDLQGDIELKYLKQLLLIEGWTDKTEYKIGDKIEFRARFTNVTDKTVHIFIPSFFDPLGFVFLYEENYPSFTLGSPDPVCADADIDLYPQKFYEGSVLYTIPGGTQLGSGWQPLLPGNYLVVTDLFIENRRLNYLNNKLDAFLWNKWSQIGRGKPPRLEKFPNKYNFPIISIVE